MLVEASPPSDSSLQASFQAALMQSSSLCATAAQIRDITLINPCFMHSKHFGTCSPHRPKIKLLSDRLLHGQWDHQTTHFAVIFSRGTTPVPIMVAQGARTEHPKQPYINDLPSCPVYLKLQVCWHCFNLPPTLYIPY